jgi:hypothetical protein
VAWYNTQVGPSLLDYARVGTGRRIRIVDTPSGPGRAGGRSLGGLGPHLGSQPPNTALEAMGHSGYQLVGVGRYGVARASAWALGA